MANYARLAGLLGPARLKDIVFTARPIEIDEALAIGLRPEVAEPDAIEARIEELCEQLASHAPVDAARHQGGAAPHPRDDRPRGGGPDPRGLRQRGVPQERRERFSSVITGALILLYTTDPEADRGFFSDVLELPVVDVGGGWLIFAPAPRGLAAHPAERTPTTSSTSCATTSRPSWPGWASAKHRLQRGAGPGLGLLSHAILPGGGKLGVYQPKQPRPGPP